MKTVRRLGLSAVAAALVFATAAEARANEVDVLAHHVAGRSAAFRLLLDRLSNPDFARLAVESAVRGDAWTFNQLFEDLDLQVPNKCFFISDVIETISNTIVEVEECVLRDNLTVAEMNQYLAIAFRHGQLGGRVGTQTPSYLETDASGRTLVKPSAFLEDLRAAGLVTCQMVKKYYGTTLVFGKPERFCFQQPPSRP